MMPSKLYVASGAIFRVVRSLALVALFFNAGCFGGVAYLLFVPVHEAVMVVALVFVIAGLLISLCFLVLLLLYVACAIQSDDQLKKYAV